MRRADRLFQIIQILRRRRVTTAAKLSEELEVSLRTVYRDIQDLQGSGVDIEGEAGVGYTLKKGFDLPPLMFTQDELTALVLGTRMVRSHGDKNLRRAADDVLSKVETVLPKGHNKKFRETAIFSPNFKPDRHLEEYLPRLRQGVEKKRKVAFEYARKDGLKSKRTVRPLCLAFIVPHWMLGAWCELRQEFRNFRLDRMVSLRLLEEGFEEEKGKSLEDFIVHVRGRG